MKLYLVGGAVRDLFMGNALKDLDFAVEAESYEAMRAGLKDRYALRVYESRPEFVCLRGSVKLNKAEAFGLPEDMCWNRVNGDFTLCREERMYHDRRHPSNVTPATLGVDLKRRDYTINAVAIDEDGHMIDPFGGRLHMLARLLDTVGDADLRFDEDPLRILRGVRFKCNLDLQPARQVAEAWNTFEIVEQLATVKIERVREELARVRDWHLLMSTIMVEYPMIGNTLSQYFPRLWFKPTVESR